MHGLAVNCSCSSLSILLIKTWRHQLHVSECSLYKQIELERVEVAQPGLYGALRVRDGKVLARCATSRHSKCSLASHADVDNPSGDLFLITATRSLHTSLETCTWLEEHPRLHHVIIPTGAYWLNVQEG